MQAVIDFFSYINGLGAKRHDANHFNNFRSYFRG